MSDRALVKNAADRDQVKYADRTAKRRARRLVDALRATLKTVPGRQLVWELLSTAGVFATMYRTDPHDVYYAIGRQNFGQELLALCLEAGADLYLLMETEARARDRRDDAATDAAHTPSAALTQEGADTTT